MEKNTQAETCHQPASSCAAFVLKIHVTIPTEGDYEAYGNQAKEWCNGERSRMGKKLLVCVCSLLKKPKLTPLQHKGWN